MASNRQAESLCWICVFTMALLLPPATFCRADERKLPSARELIRETQALYTGDEKPDSWVVLELARALAHLGDLKAARDLLAPPKPDSLFDDSLIASGYLTIAEIEIATTGSTAPLPDFLNRDLKGHNHLELAEAYARHGYVDKALAQVNSLPANDNFSLRFSGYRVVESLHAGGHRDAAREVLVRWTKCYSNSKTTFHYIPWEKIDQLVGLLFELGERETAKAFCERWHGIMVSDTDIDEHGEFIGRGWANLGLAWFRLGEKTKAERALQQSRIWLDKAQAAEENPHEPNKLIDRAKVLAILAAKMEAAFGTEAARETYELAYQAAGLVVPSDYGFYGFEQIVDAQLENNDSKAAMRTIERIASARSAANCWREICEHARKRGDGNTAKLAAREAAQIFLSNEFKPFIANDMARAAAEIAQAGENELAKQVFERAIAYSNANDDPKFDHHWIARMQVLGGQFGDAYQTIGAIELPEDRALPLAQLASAVAKAEFLAAKTRKK